MVCRTVSLAMTFWVTFKDIAAIPDIPKTWVCLRGYLKKYSKYSQLITVQQKNGYFLSDENTTGNITYITALLYDAIT